MIENRNGLVVAACATQSSTKAEREAALAMLEQRGRSPGEVKKKRLPAITLGADKLYQEKKFIAALRRRKVIPHVAEYEANAHWPNWLTKKERRTRAWPSVNENASWWRKCLGGPSWTASCGK